MTNPNPRVATYPIDAQFLNRWSPRAFAENQITESELLVFLEAARWAPSSYNAQPWRFVFARRGTPHWDTLFSLLNEFNQSWAHNAAALVFLVSKTTFAPPGTEQELPAPTHSFDTGAAWGYLALQASLSGWYAHGMAGFDKEKARLLLHIPHNFSIEAAVAIGKLGDKSSLPEDLRQRDFPSPRYALQELVFEGEFKEPT